MAGAGTYRVGLGETYNDIQSALDALVVDQGVTPFAATQTILVTDSRTYAEFSTSGLNPTSTYRLVIKSDAGQNPVVSRSSEENFNGVIIETDHTTLRGLTIRGFVKGVVVNAVTGVKILNCIVVSNSVIGVYVKECDSFLIACCALSESESLLTLSDCVTPSVIHNSFSNFKYGRYAVNYIPVREVGGEAVMAEDNQLYFFNNVLSCDTTPCMILPEGYQRAFKDFCNGNAYYSGSGAVAEIFEDIDGVFTSRNIGSLASWRMESGGDHRSRYGRPIFLTNATSGGPIDDLTLDQFSPLGLKGVELITDSDYTLPAFILDEDLDADLFETERRSPPTPGVFELNPSSDFDFASMFGSYAPSEDEVSGIDRTLRQMEKSLDCLTPQIKSGFFFSRDAKYYLYSDKAGIPLKEATHSEIELPVLLSDITVNFGGSTAEFQQFGRTLLVSHAGTGVSDEIEGSIDVIGTMREWDDPSSSFIESQVIFSYRPWQNKLRYFLPTEPKDGAPIVVTDDLVGLNDSRDIVPYVFTTRYSHEHSATELLFEGQSNRFANSDFSYKDEADAPLLWSPNTSEQPYTVEAVPVVELTTDVLPVVGDNLLHCSVDTSHNGDPFISQDIYLVDPQSDLTLSFYIHSYSEGALTLRLTSFDQAGSALGVVDVPVDVDGLVTNTSDPSWERVSLFCKRDPESEFSDRGAAADVTLPDISLYFEDDLSPTMVRVDVRPVDNATCYLDAFMATETNVLKKYSRMTFGDDTTIEYESSDAKVHLLEDLSLNTIVNPQHTGFLTIPRLKATEFDATAPADADTLYERRWAAGRTTYLPWAKLDGVDKYVFTAGLVPPYSAIELPSELGFRPPLAVPTTIKARPTTPVAGWNAESPGYFVATVYDQFDNPYAWSDATVYLTSEYGNFPGWLGVRELSVPSILNTSVTVETDPSGSVALEVFGPGDEHLLYAGSAPTSDYIDVPYRVSQISHGNVLVEDFLSGQAIDLIGDEVTEDLSGTVDGDLRVIQLTQIPFASSVQVFVTDTSSYDMPLARSSVPPVEPWEFYVDETIGEIQIRKSAGSSARVKYEPRLAWTDEAYPRRIFFDDAAVDLMTSHIIVRYDAQVSLVVECDTVSEEYPVILRGNG